MKTYKSTASNISLKKSKSTFQNVKISSSKDSEKFMRQFFHDDLGIYESFFLLLLNRANNTIGFSKISHGGVASTVVDTIIIAKFAIDSLASSVILCHNHPSGNKAPSTADIFLTKKVKEALKLFDINVLDHIILTEESYTSLADEGLIA